MDLFTKTVPTGSPDSYDLVIPYTYRSGLGGGTILGVTYGSEDTGIGYAQASSNKISTINKNMRGIGLHGLVPPGTIAIVVPLQNLNDLSVYLDSGKAFPRLEPATNNTAFERGLPPNAAILLPGSTHDFGAEISGVALWCGSSRNDCVLNDYQNAYGGDFPMPVVRVFGARSSIPPALKYRQIPAVSFIDEPAVTGSDANVMSVADWLAQDPPRITRLYDVDTVLLTACKLAGTPVSTETQRAEIWWLTTANYWVHNEADDLDSSGRGEISSMHTVECYDIPPAVTGMLIMPMSGDTLCYFVHQFNSRQR